MPIKFEVSISKIEKVTSFWNWNVTVLKKKCVFKLLRTMHLGVNSKMKEAVSFNIVGILHYVKAWWNYIPKDAKKYIKTILVARALPLNLPTIALPRGCTVPTDAVVL